MSELGDLLELLYRAHSSWRTVRMETRDWTHRDRAELAFERHRERTAAVAYARSVQLAGRDPAPVETTSRAVTWVHADGRYRHERGEAGYRMTQVFDGSRVWIYSADFGAVVHDRHSAALDDDLLDPRPVMVALDLEVLGRRDHVGRRALEARGIPRDDRHDHGLAVPPGADEVLLLVEAERGVLLRKEARFDGEPFQIRDVIEIAFDEEPPVGTFAFEPPPGEEIRSAEDASRPEHLTLEEAARRCSFTVYAPTKLTPDWRLVVVYRAAGERPPIPETVHLLLHDDALHHFAIEESAEPPLAWRDDAPTIVERDGLEVRAFAGEGRGTQAEVQLERDGTHVRLSSDSLPVESLIDVAASLEPAPTEPPSIVA
jgi:outer membrane lipoprotein-sorting protein